MPRDISGYHETYQLLAVQDPNAAEVNTLANGYISMVGHEWGVIVCSATLTDTKTAIFEMTQASDVAGTGKADVSGFTKTLTGAAGTTRGLYPVGQIDFNVNDLTDASETKHFVGVDCTTDQATDLASAVLYLGGGDYQSSDNAGQ